MSRNQQFTDEQKQHILKEVEENGLAITIRKHGLNARSIYRWREKLQHPDRRVEGQKRTPDDAELRRLRYENQQLKELIAEKELAIRIKDALLKNGIGCEPSLIALRNKVGFYVRGYRRVRPSVY